MFAPDENLWFVACRMYIVNYGLIAKATIMFSKQNGTATKGGQLLYEDGY